MEAIKMSNVDLRNLSAAFDAMPVGRSMVPSNRQLTCCKTTITYEEDNDCEDDDDDEKLVMHFAHSHPLAKFEMKESDRSKCNICGILLIGSARGCKSCGFYIHQSCVDLPMKICHDSHPAHTLELHHPNDGKSSSSNKCDGCRATAHAGFYRCKICDYDVHVTCAVLYTTARKNGNSFKLNYTSPFRGSSAFCVVCYSKIPGNGWVYYNKDTRCAAHVKCVGSNIAADRVRDRLDEIRADRKA